MSQVAFSQLDQRVSQDSRGRWPFLAPVFEIETVLDPHGAEVGYEATCIEIPEPRRSALRNAVREGLSRAERDAIHEFLHDEAEGA